MIPTSTEKPIMENYFRSYLVNKWKYSVLLLISFFFTLSNLNAQCDPPQLVGCPAGVVSISLPVSGQANINQVDLGITSTSNCGVVTFSLSNNSFTCADVGFSSQFVTVTATNSGGSTSCQVPVIVLDAGAPVLTSIPDENYTCFVPSSINMPSALDACEGPVVPFFSDVVSTSSGITTISRTWTAADASGNSSSFVQLITVSDTENPTFSVSPSTFPTVQTISCSNLYPSSPVVTATDNCGLASTPVVSYASTRAGLSPADAAFYTYDSTTTFTATDLFGNQSSYSYTVSVEDTEGPTFTGIPSATVITTSGVPSPCDGLFQRNHNAAVADNCASTSRLTNTYEVTNAAGNSVAAGNGLIISQSLSVGTYTVTLSSSDPSNNTSSFSYSLSVQDQNAPTATFLPSATVSVPTSGSLDLASLPNVLASGVDDCSSTVSVSYNPSFFDCSDVGTTQQVFATVTDESNNSTTVGPIDVTVVDNSPPAIACVSSFGVTLDANGFATVTPADLAQGLLVDFDACGPNSWAVARAGSRFSSTVMLNCVDASNSPVQLELSVWDNAGNQSICTVSVTVADDTDPVASCQDITRTLNALGSYRLTQADLLEISRSGLAGGSSDACGLSNISVQPSYFDCSVLDATKLASQGFDSVDITLTVEDNAGNSATCDTVIVIRELTAPAISCVDRTLSANSDGDLIVEVDDVLAGDIFLQSLAGQGLTTVSYTADNAYDLSFDYDVSSVDLDFRFGYIINGVANTSLFSLIGGNSATGTATVALNAGDVIQLYVNEVGSPTSGNGGSAWVRNLTVSLSTNNAATSGRPVKGSELSAISGGGSGYYVDAACAPLDFEIALAGSSNYGPSVALTCASSSADVTIRATDGAGNVSTCTSTITILDQSAPILTLVAQTVELGSAGNADVIASSFDNGSSYDACGTITSFFFTDALGQPLQPNPSILNVSCADEGSTLTVYIAAEDNNGNIGYGQTTLTVEDNRGPDLSIPTAVTVDCDDPASLDPSNTGFATATDNCDGAIALNSISITTTQVPAPAGVCVRYRRRFEATDSRGNVSFGFQSIDVIDNVPPTFATPSQAGYFANQVAECNNLARPVIGVYDNCTPSASIMVGIDTTDSRIDYSVTPAAFTVTAADAGYYNYNISRVYTITDNCGNSAQKSQLVSVSDNLSPVYTGSIPSVQLIDNDPLSCSARVSFDITGNLEDCADEQYLTVTNDAAIFGAGDGQKVSDGIYNVGTHTVTFTVSDPSGNSSIVPFTFTVRDNESPVAKCISNFNLNLSSSGVGQLVPSDLDNNSTDNCGIASYTLSQSLFDCSDIGFNQVVLSVVDHAGNESQCTTLVNVQAASVPVFTFSPVDVTINCDDDINDLALTGQAQATAACPTNLSITYADAVTSGMGDCRVVERTWTAAYPNGASATYIQTITVQDSQSPTLVGVPAPSTFNRTFNCMPAPFRVITAADNCTAILDSNIVSTQSADPASSAFYNYSISRRYTALDACGNSSAPITLTDVFRDFNAPSINVPDQTISANQNTCEGTFNLSLSDFTSDCADNQYLSFSHDAASIPGVGTGNFAERIQGTLPVGVYTVRYRVSDPSGNTSTMQSFTITVEDNQAPDVACLDITVPLVNGTATITPSQLDNNSSDNCTAQSDLTYSIDQSTFNTPGNYSVLLTVTDEAGNATQCNSTVTVTAPLTLSSSSVFGQSGNIVTLDVTAENFTSVSGISGTVNLVNTNVADFVSGSITYNQIFTPSDWGVFVSDDQLTFVYTGSGPTAVSLPASGAVLFSIDVLLTGAIGDATDVMFASSPTSLTAVQNFTGTNVTVTPAVNPSLGQVSVIGSGGMPTVGGFIHSAYQGESGIGLVDVGYMGSASGSMTTSADGIYNFTVPTGSNATITPVKDVNHINGVDVIDLIMVRQHVLSNPALQLDDPYQRIAADAYRDGTIDILDLIEIQRVSLGGNNFSNNLSWRFVLDGQALTVAPGTPDVPVYQESASLSNIMMSMDSVNFTALKVGDVNFTNDTSALTGGTATGNRRADALQLIVKDRQVRAGETVDVEFRTSNFDEIMGYQLGLVINGGEIENAPVGALQNMTTGNFRVASANKLTHVWDNASLTPVANGELAFTLSLTATRTTQLSELIALDDNLLTAKGYTNGLIARPVVLVFEQVVSTTSATDLDLALSQNRPNPFASETSVDLTLAAAQSVLFELIDVTGRTVYRRDINGIAGKQTITIGAQDLPSAGVYHYRVTTSNGTLTKSLMYQN